MDWYLGKKNKGKFQIQGSQHIDAPHISSYIIPLHVLQPCATKPTLSLSLKSQPHSNCLHPNFYAVALKVAIKMAEQRGFEFEAGHVTIRSTSAIVSPLQEYQFSLTCHRFHNRALRRLSLNQ
jgi:hypothetical protein